MHINGFKFWGLLRPGPKTLPPPDIFEFFEYVRRGQLPDDYTTDHRYADFRKVFMSDPTGQRVLYQIFDWAGLIATTDPDVTDAERLFRTEGRRELAAAIMAALNAEVAIFGPHQSEENPTGDDDG